MHSMIDENDIFAESQTFRYTPGYEAVMVELAGGEENKNGDEQDEEEDDN